LSTIKQINNGDPIDINILNQMIAAINSLSIQIAQIYNLPSPQSSFVVNNTGPTGSTQANADGATLNTKIVQVKVLAGSKQEGFVPYKSSFGRSTVTITTDMVQKAVGSTIKIKDFAIAGIGYSNLQAIFSGTTKTTATGLKILSTSYGKSFSWQFEKGGLNAWSPGKTAPADNATGDKAKIFFSWSIDVEVSY
jgi:hypothetical protein